MHVKEIQEALYYVEIHLMKMIGHSMVLSAGASAAEKCISRGYIQILGRSLLYKRIGYHIIFITLFYVTFSVILPTGSMQKQTKNIPRQLLNLQKTKL